MEKKQTHYFDAKPEVISNPREIHCRYGGIDFIFTTDSGVFSKNKPDFGSDLMISAFIAQRKAGLAKGKRVMDLGCGYGLVGTIIKRVFPETEITMGDVNQRAIALATTNAEKNHVKFADIRVSDIFSTIEGSFDIILTNPPVRAGKATVFKFYEGAYERLNQGGCLFVVIQKKQGAESSEKRLDEIFGNCVTIDKDAGYRVYQCIKTVKSNEQMN